ncbi:MAG: carbohydrate kinase [Phaeodactylibacter sp.]|nr:carbohydrate kinase [Phaeodactylibacter sp.]MCB9274569.1 carbohydrate kinase [Lewinellaceae bacterium]
MYLLGYDIGSSAIKAALVHAETRHVTGIVQYPEHQMDMISRHRGWAEQQPEVWWHDFSFATQRLLEQTGVRPKDIQAIGIGYQMHGLVLIDKEQRVLRPSIIWCDSRAVAIGQQAFQELGEEYCLKELLNSPGNFTASKLKWVKDNEPGVYEKADKLLLPGDFIAMKLTGEAMTTISGLTEGIFWNYLQNKPDDALLRHYGLRESLLADTVPAFSIQGRVTPKAAERTGLAVGTPVTYRAGDQPNNALALNVLHPGEVAATSGTSGVVYGIVSQPVFDRKSRVNSFAHVNYEERSDRIGVLLCLNGAGIEYSWIKRQVARSEHSYNDMERMASTVPVGSDGLCLLPFGNGAERMLEDRNLNAHIFNLDFNRHTRAHLYRASLEGIAFSFVYGLNILKELGLNVDVIRVANDNMFQSKIFSTTIATMLGSQIQVVETTGAIGAARAAGVAIGVFGTLEDALEDVRPAAIYQPEINLAICQQAYNYWESRLKLAMEERLAGQRATDAGATEKAEELKKEVRRYNKELAASKLQLDAANKFLADVRASIQKAEGAHALPELAKLLQQIDTRLNNSRDWEDFEIHFGLLHNDFFEKLNSICPGMSLQELKMCAYLKMKLSTKEMASRLGLSIRGTETCRYRLRQKLGLSKRENLLAFLEALSTE